MTEYARKILWLTKNKELHLNCWIYNYCLNEPQSYRILALKLLPFDAAIGERTSNPTLMTYVQSSLSEFSSQLMTAREKKITRSWDNVCLMNSYLSGKFLDGNFKCLALTLMVSDISVFLSKQSLYFTRRKSWYWKSSVY